MDKNVKRFLTGVLILCFVSTFAGLALAGGDVTIIGTINDDNQFVDSSGTVYEVVDNEMAGEVLEHVGEKVQVMGTVMEGDAGKTITITSYEVIEE